MTPRLLEGRPEQINAESQTLSIYPSVVLYIMYTQAVHEQSSPAWFQGNDSSPAAWAPMVKIILRHNDGPWIARSMLNRYPAIPDLVQPSIVPFGQHFHTCVVQFLIDFSTVYSDALEFRPVQEIWANSVGMTDDQIGVSPKH